ncbi:MAG: RNA pseudouridine synthase [Rhodothermales bacterium]|nr:RNA pseudouridine synthase [Rhodothermales bacterium]
MPEPIYVDNHLLVVVKPAGMLSQADRTGDPDLLSVWKDWIRREYDKPGDVFLGLVHRLDRPASGVMVLARTSKAARRLADQFRRRTVEKCYVAVVEAADPGDGAVTPLQGAGRWTDHIRKRGSTPEIVPASRDGARTAVLTWNARPLETRGRRQISLADIRLETGRPHQIRLQFSSRGYPIVGDMRYGAGTPLDGRNLALHAWSLTFDHPTRREPLTFCCLPPTTWPDDAVEACRSLLTGRCENVPHQAPSLED